LLSAEIDLSAKTYPDEDARRRFGQRFAQEMEGLEGRPSFTLSSGVVPRGTEPLSVSGQVAAEKSAEGVDTQAVADNFFSLMNIPLLQGRGFASGDRENTQRVAIVNQALVKRYFPRGDAIGRQIKLSRADDNQTPWLTVVGVVSNVKTSSVFQEMGYVETPAVYRPLSQEAPEALTVIVAVAPGTSGNLIAEMQRRLSGLGPNLVLGNVQTVEQLQAHNLAQPRFRALLLGSFAALALLLASLGLYGVLAQLVSQKTREIGIRMALGADRVEILGSVLKRAFALVGAGIFAGVAGAVFTGMLLRGLLYGVGAEDPTVLFAVVIIMLVVGAAAALQPALRASLLDPAIVLRSE
jgi:predicted permease